MSQSFKHGSRGPFKGPKLISRRAAKGVAAQAISGHQVLVQCTRPWVRGSHSSCYSVVGLALTALSPGLALLHCYLARKSYCLARGAQGRGVHFSSS